MNGSKFYTISNYFPKLKYPEKYIGKNKVITLRSSYEIQFVKNFLDRSPDVKFWSSEDVVIKYLYEIDGRIHRYFVDFYFKHVNGKEFLIEIKPKNQVFPPKVPKRRTRSYRNRINIYIKNQNKWKYAKNYCKNLREEKGRNIEFKILTEKELGIKV